MGYGPYQRTVATDSRIYSEAQSRAWNVRTSAAGFPSGSQWDSLDLANRRPMGRYARSVSAQKYLPSTFPAMDRIGGFCQDIDGIGPGLERTRRHRPERGIYRWNLCSGQKRGDTAKASRVTSPEIIRTKNLVCGVAKSPDIFFFRSTHKSL